MTGKFELTRHVYERVNGRLHSLITIEEVHHAVERNLPKGRCYVQIKRIPYTEVSDPSVKPDGIARGDQLVAVVDNDNCPRITTVLLRKSWSKSPEYSNIIR